MPNARVAAAAGGLPSRRAAFVALASAAAVLSLSKAAQAAGTVDPEVAELARLYDAAMARTTKALAAVEAAEARIVHPPVPEAMFEDPSDALSRVFRADHYSPSRRWYGNPERIALLRSWSCEGLGTSKWWRPVLARRAEVLAAYDGWEAARLAA